LQAPKLCSSIARRWPAGTAEELFDLFFKDKGDLARASAGSKRFSPGRKKEKREGRQERREPQVPAREACWTKKHERSFLNQIRRRSPAQIHAPLGARGCAPTIQ
jgi:hypothetical protein